MHLPALGLILGIKIDRICCTNLDALTAPGAGLFVDEQQLRSVVRNRLIDSLPLSQSMIEFICDFYGSDVHAFAHFVADCRIDQTGLL